MTTFNKPPQPQAPAPRTRPSNAVPPTTRATPTKRGLNLSPTQIGLIVLVIIGISVIIDFNRKIQSGQRIGAEAQELRDQVTALAATKAALATEYAYVSSDAYVQYWAHADGRYIQSNEILVVPLPAKKEPTSQPTPVRVAQKLPSNFEMWWALFFESP